MLAGLGGPAGHPQWMLSGPPPTIVILADDYQRVPTATRNVPRSPRGCHRPGARPGTSDGGCGSPRRGAFSCTACFLRGPGMSESNRSSCVRARADRARLRTRGSASGWGPCSTFLCVFFALPWGVHGGRGRGCPPSRYQATRVVVVPVRRRFGVLLRPFPRRWLHRLHIVRPLSSVFVPPSDHGVMWSGSGLSGCRLVSHASVTPHVGQVVCPAARSRLRTAARQRLCPVVPVLLVVMVGGGGWLLAGGWFAVPPPAGVVRRGGHLARGRWWPGLGGWGGGCWRARRARGRGVVP